MAMIIVYDGCHADELEQQTADLTTKATQKLSSRIRGLFQSLKPRGFLGSLAAGADTLFAEAALGERGKDEFFEVLLPFDETTFREKRVEPAGEPWVSDYD